MRLYALGIWERVARARSARSWVETSLLVVEHALWIRTCGMESAWEPALALTVRLLPRIRQLERVRWLRCVRICVRVCVSACVCDVYVRAYVRISRVSTCCTARVDYLLPYRLA